VQVRLDIARGEPARVRGLGRNGTEFGAKGFRSGSPWRRCAFTDQMSSSSAVLGSRSGRSSMGRVNG
jgi:hypothetical protein